MVHDIEVCAREPVKVTLTLYACRVVVGSERVAKPVTAAWSAPGSS